MIETLKDPNIWEEVSLKFYKSDVMDLEQKMCISILRRQDSIDKVIKQIENKEYKWSIPTKYEIPKSNGKFRLVYVHSLQDRLLLSVLNKIYTRDFSDNVSKHVYSYKEDMRSMSAVQSLLKDEGLFNKYSMKLDISAFFNSVNKESLENLINNVTETDTAFKYLLTKLLFTNKCKYKGTIINEYMSLIPGNALSSFLSNAILKPLDDRISKLDSITYARYADDMIFFADSKEEFQPIISMVLEELDKLGLSINPDKYEYTDIGEPFEFLGLKVYKDLNTCRSVIDLKDSNIKKIKKKIKSEAKRRRKLIEVDKRDPDYQVTRMIYRLNSSLYKTYFYDPSKFGWAYYAFNNINTIESLRQLDFYLKEQLRYLYTGKHNKSNISKLPTEKLYELGMLSFVNMYQTFKLDKDFYMTKIREIEFNKPS